MTGELRNELTAGALALGVELTDEEALLLLKYLILLQKWNERINLTGTRDDHLIVTRHLLDSMALLPHVPTGAETLIDVGSGAGLPGAVIAIFRPDLQVVALEPIRKKHAFLSALRRELPLPNFRPLSQRLEDFLLSTDAALFDAAVSRATWPVGDWLKRAVPLLRADGVALGMEATEATDLPAGASRHVYDLGDRTRAVISWQPVRRD